MRQICIDWRVSHQEKTTVRRLGESASCATIDPLILPQESVIHPRTGPDPAEQTCQVFGWGGVRSLSHTVRHTPERGLIDAPRRSVHQTVQMSPVTPRQASQVPREIVSDDFGPGERPRGEMTEIM